MAAVEVQSDSGQVEGPVLFIDMDGTLFATDLLWEACVGLLKKRPSLVLLMPLWLLRGRAGFKQAISDRHAPDPTALPYREDVLAYLRDRKSAGTRLVLATASTRAWAESVAAHLGLFDDVLTSDGEKNLKGSHKLTAIQAYCESRGFDHWGYMGDSSADLPIWAQAPESHAVAPSSSTLARARARTQAIRVFGRRPSRVRAVVKALRPHQWVKNTLLFVPLLLARQYTDLEKSAAALIAFATFSLCASAVYVINDLLDVEADRAHPRKRRRPFASGALPMTWGPPLATVLLLASIGGAAVTLSPRFVLVLVLYMLATSAYSALLKKLLLVDVLVLASLYTLRLFAGGVATGVAVSEWLLAFSIFFFTSLAFAKRHIEMARLKYEGKAAAKGRGYRVEDISLLESFGATSGYLAVLVFAFYVHDGLPHFYNQRWLLWLTCPLLLFWISRLWFLAKRGTIHDDPVVFAVTDKTSLVVGFGVALMVLLAAPLW